MALRNGPDEFGLISRLIHWGMALLLISLLALGLRIAAMEPSLSTLWLYGLHKTLGLTALALLLLRVIWHLISPPPGPQATGWMRLFIKAWHWTLYALMIATPIAGWAGSSASGIDTLYAETFVIPPLVEPNETSEFVWFILHEIFAKTLLGMVIVHMLAALKREMDGDGTLTRMLRGRA
ncbi:cytochrome b/b6 domain-containing protein [Tabrizicola sp.]|uniref:cytochrome b n=1 Tax=Tabrizicola sp. TaxID=2005166 RepID=UPI0025D013BB|nr:cytochrome b/b6 domain-containing protein [Tabrizicola sp.]